MLVFQLPRSFPRFVIRPARNLSVDPLEESQTIVHVDVPNGEMLPLDAPPYAQAPTGPNQAREPDHEPWVGKKLHRIFLAPASNGNRFFALWFCIIVPDAHLFRNNADPSLNLTNEKTKTGPWSMVDTWKRFLMLFVILYFCIL